MHQLALTDAKGGDPHQSWLYKVATAGGPGALQSFRTVVLVASPQVGLHARAAEPGRVMFAGPHCTIRGG